MLPGRGRSEGEERLGQLGQERRLRRGGSGCCRRRDGGRRGGGRGCTGEGRSGRSVDGGSNGNRRSGSVLCGGCAGGGSRRGNRLRSRHCRGEGGRHCHGCGACRGPGGRGRGYSCGAHDAGPVLTRDEAGCSGLWKDGPGGRIRGNGSGGRALRLVTRGCAAGTGTCRPGGVSGWCELLSRRGRTRRCSGKPSDGFGCLPSGCGGASCRCCGLAKGARERPRQAERVGGYGCRGRRGGWRFPAGCDGGLRGTGISSHNAGSRRSGQIRCGRSGLSRIGRRRTGLRGPGLRGYGLRRSGLRRGGSGRGSGTSAGGLIARSGSDAAARSLAGRVAGGVPVRAAVVPGTWSGGSRRRAPCPGVVRGFRLGPARGGPDGVVQGTAKAFPRPRGGTGTRLRAAGRGRRLREGGRQVRRYRGLHEAAPAGTIRRIAVRLDCCSQASRIWMVLPGTGASIALPLPR